MGDTAQAATSLPKVLAFFTSGGEIDHFFFAQQAMRALGGPPTFAAPINEWYSWTPSPRANPDVKVVLTLDPSNFPPLCVKKCSTRGTTR
jgi:hypothetical protein